MRESRIDLAARQIGDLLRCCGCNQQIAGRVRHGVDRVRHGVVEAVVFDQQSVDTAERVACGERVARGSIGFRVTEQEDRPSAGGSAA